SLSGGSPHAETVNASVTTTQGNHRRTDDMAERIAVFVALSFQLSAFSSQLVVSGVEMKDFRKLDVWQTARAMTKSVYQCTRAFPPDETFGRFARFSEHRNGLRV